MAFTAKDLSVLAYANGFTLWHYLTNDLSADVDTTGYFNGVSELMRVGDMILLNADRDGAPESGILVVNSNSAGVVDTANLTRFDATDTD